MATFGILVGGGPAPGINGVIGAATILARRSGARVLGLVDGFKWLMKGDTSHVFELRIGLVSRVHLLGGSILQTSRANPTKKPEDLARVVATLQQLGVDHLITIGGDDTAFSARRVAEQAAGRSAWRTCRRPSTTTCRCPAASRPSASRPRASTRRASSRNLMEDAAPPSAGSSW